MVRSVSNLSRNGVSDWIIQRVSAVIMVVYVFFLLAFMMFCGPIDFAAWQALYANTAMRIFSVLFLLSLIFHAWVGIWTISTDYIKHAFLRSAFQLVVLLALFCCFVWGIAIFWMDSI